MKYIGRWRILASHVKDRPSDEESIEIISKGAQAATEALLCLQPITSFASLTRASACVESSLWSGNFPTLADFAKQATASSSNNYNKNCNSSSNKGNNDADIRYYKKPTVTCIDPPAKPALIASQPSSSQLASAHNVAHTTQSTATIEPVHHIAPAQQGQQPKQR